MKNELDKKYNEILEEMNRNGILFSGITRKKVSEEGTEIIKKHLINLFSAFDKFPFKIKIEYWLEVETLLKKEMGSLEKDYSDKLKNIADPHTTKSNDLFQGVEKWLQLLIKDHISKSGIEGFESEAFYRMANNKRSIAALWISCISLVISLIALLSKWLFK